MRVSKPLACDNYARDCNCAGCEAQDVINGLTRKPPEPRITPAMVSRLKRAILAHIHGTADKVDAWAARENRRTR